MSLFEILDWDTKFFGFKVGRISAPRLYSEELLPAIQAMKAAGVTLAYWEASHTEGLIPLISQSGGFFVGTKVTYGMDFRAEDHEPIAPEPHLEICQDKILGRELTELSLQSGSISRFRLDPKIATEKFEQLYKGWMQRSLAGDMAQVVFVWKTDAGKIVGMVTVGEKGGRGDIGLMAVDKDYRRQKIGAQLVRAAQFYSCRQGLTSGQVVTQGENRPACMLYEKCGYRIEKMVWVFHFWL